MSLVGFTVTVAASGSWGEARMRLECEVRSGRYFLFVARGRRRWQLVAPGADTAAAARGFTREEALRQALLAGFSTKEAESAIGAAQSRSPDSV